MRIAVISTPVFKLPLTGYGGLEALAWYQAKGLAERGHQVMLIAPDGSECPGVQIVPIGPAGFVNEEMAYSGFPEIKNGWQVMRPAHAGYWQNLLNVDVVIDNSWQKMAMALRREGALKAPILAVCHAPVDTMYKELPPPGILSFVCISNDQKNHFEALFNRPARTAYNGIDLNFYKPLDVPRSNRFLFLARFSYIKGAHIAIEACKKAGVGLDLIGDTKLTGEPEYLQSIIGMGDGKQIRFVGPASRGETVWWYSQAHCMLHPNKNFREPFGLAPVESLACGTPVISWDYGAMRETMVDGLTGNLVRSEEQLGDCIKLQSKMSWPKEGRDECREQASKFTIEAMCQRYEKLCREAISNGGW